ncbi:MAG: GMC family oxidoreductase, partial [Hyphomicrobium sp.]
MTTRLSISATALKPRYDAVVIGSGYGGGVAACRLARMGLAVAVLERGRELLPGEFPSTATAASREVQVRGKTANFGSETALFDVRLGEDIHVLMACGLGGTSLINANVCLMPDPRVFDNPVWPTAIRTDRMLAEGYVRARHMLRPVADPATRSFQKVKALATASEVVGSGVDPVPLHIAFAHGPNAAGIVQPACVQCGDCCGGCNVGAKTTVANTYLADAKAFGAEIFTEGRVRSLAKEAGGGWRITLRRPAGARSGWTDASVHAGIVVVAAGTLGTTEILLRSRDSGLALSDRLGTGVTSNGDAIAIAYNNDMAVNGVGVGHPPRAETETVGAAVNGLVDLRANRPVTEGLAIVECALPSSMASLLPAMLVPGGALFGQDGGGGIRDELDEFGRAAVSLLRGAYKGAVHQTQTFLAVGHDEGDGQLRLDNDRVVFDWPGVPKQAVFRRIEDVLKAMTAATGGTYMKNPAAEKMMGGNMMTVHPMGGCRIGADCRAGVVNDTCQVFDGSAGAAPDAVHEGLYVMDGSVVPSSLGVHPLLTISAIA